MTILRAQVHSWPYYPVYSPKALYDQPITTHKCMPQVMSCMPRSSCVDPASDIQICSIVNYYFRISLAGSPAMDLLDVADSYHKCSQYLFCWPNICFESIFCALQVPGKVALNLLRVREGYQNSLQSRKVPPCTLAPRTLARVHSRIHSRPVIRPQLHISLA